MAYATCVFVTQAIVGTIIMKETPGSGIRFKGKLTNVPPGEHGIIIHEKGHTDNACENIGDHFNPTGVHHGPHESSAEHHAGDLGNIRADNDKIAEVDIHDPSLTLKLDETFSILGRSIAIHRNRDDGEAGGEGHVGKPIGCCRITAIAVPVHS